MLKTIKDTLVEVGTAIFLYEFVMPVYIVLTLLGLIKFFDNID
jgi:hypothetical protein